MVFSAITENNVINNLAGNSRSMGVKRMAVLKMQ